MCNQSPMASFLLVLSGLHGASSFTTSIRPRRLSHGQLISKPSLPHHTHTSSSSTSTHATTTTTATSINWTPQDLTKDNDGFLPIPPNDYIKQYQANPLQLWPVEFFVIVYRHIPHTNNTPTSNTSTTTSTTTTTTTQTTTAKTTQILVRKSANGTSKYGVGTGVPVTRWMLSSQSPPKGYQKVFPEIKFDACNFPEFEIDADEGREEWTYSKIDICEDAFHSDSMTDDDNGDGNILEDVELEEYASGIRQQLQNELLQQLQIKGEELSEWDFNVLSTVKSILDNDNCVAAIQGSFRMSGMFGSKDTTTTDNEEKEESTPNNNNSQRHVNFNKAPSPQTIATSTKIYTMFPQMPHPLPNPTSSTPQQLRDEIATRSQRMNESGRDPHVDKYGRVYTHISTWNVSNTIHGVYMTLDASELFPPGLEGDDVPPPAYDLFGTKPIEREWVSLDELKVMEVVDDDDGQRRSVIGECDTKSEFISGFIVRQLVRDGVIGVDLE